MQGGHEKPSMQEGFFMAILIIPSWYNKNEINKNVSMCEV